MRHPARIRHALVTGASSGLGEEFARQLAARGTGLTLVARSAGALEDLASELRAASRAEVEVLTADLTDPTQLATVEERIATGEPRIDLLVNNAGFGLWGPTLDQDRERLAEMLDLNCRALVRLAHAGMPQLTTRGTGGIINVGSIAGFGPGPNSAVYSASKAFVRSFSEALYEEAKPHGVRVTLVAPGPTVTDFGPVAGLDVEGMPSFAVMEVAPVVQAALEAFTRGRPVVIPGLTNKIAARGQEFTPNRLLRRIVDTVNREASS